MERRYFLIITICFGFFKVIAAQEHNVTLNCSTTENIISPNYPSEYSNNLHYEWMVTAPYDMGIVIVFKEFITEEAYDTLEIKDPTFLSVDKIYSGDGNVIPSYISGGSILTLLFQTSGIRARKGFLLKVHCYRLMERFQHLQLSNGRYSNEGTFEVSLPEKPNEWLPVCKETWNEPVADLACRQMGFPGVYQFSSDGFAREENSSCARTECTNEDFLIQNCLSLKERKRYLNSTKLACHNHGYLGCFPLPIEKRSLSKEVTDCMYLCFLEKFELAAIHRDGCYCLNTTQARLKDFPSNEEKCISNQDLDRKWAYYYNVTTGFCDHPSDIDNGSWSSNNTYLGSRLILTCQPGYVINGSKTIECILYNASQKIDWDYEIPNCTFENSTSQLQDGASGNHPIYWPIIAYVIGVLLVVLVFCLLSYYIWKRNVMVKLFRRVQSFVASDDAYDPNKSDQTLFKTRSSNDISQAGDVKDSSTQDSPQNECLEPVPCTEESKSNECTRGNDVRSDRPDSSETTRVVDSCETREEAALEGPAIDISPTQHTPDSRSQTMKNRPLPQCPTGGALKPPLPSRKAFTLTRLDVPQYATSSKQNLPTIVSADVKKQVSKKAPAGSTPYVKSKGKRVRNIGNPKNGNNNKGFEEDSQPVSPETGDGIDAIPAPRNQSALYPGHCSESGSSNLLTTNPVITDPAEQVYADIDDPHLQGKGDGSVGMTLGAFVVGGSCGETSKPSTPLSVSNLYHTLEETSTDPNTFQGSEYEDIGKVSGTLDGTGNGGYDHLDLNKNSAN